MTTQEQLEATAKFFKEAFCVDGEVKIFTEPSDREGFKIAAVIELQDSKRGTFYLAQMTKI